MQLVMLSTFYRQKYLGWSDDCLKIINYQLVKMQVKQSQNFGLQVLLCIPVNLKSLLFILERIYASLSLWNAQVYEYLNRLNKQLILQVWFWPGSQGQIMTDGHF